MIDPQVLPTYKDILVEERGIKDLVAGLQPFRIVLGGNANADFMIPGLRVQMADEGYDAQITSSAYGNWISDSFDATEADAWVIWLSATGASRGATSRAQFDLASTCEAVERLQARGVKVVVITPEPLATEDDPFSPFVGWREDMVLQLQQGLPKSTVVMSLDHLQRRIGIDSWFASRYWDQAKSPCHPDAATAVGVEVGSTLARTLRPRVKAVVVDLDDTLWGGLVGEVGAEGIELDPDGAGRAYLELQRFLVDLSDRGVAIGIVSKNEDAIARKPFTERSEMVLKLDHVVSFSATWNSKYEAIEQFAKQLNVGIDSVCFLDDSAFERDEAQRMLPGLIVPDLPKSPDKRVSYLVRSKLFLMPSVSDEDKLRVQFYKREADIDIKDRDQYLASLEMQLEVSAISSANLDRVVALLHKTNQFNATMWRPSAAEVSSFVASSNNYGYAFRLNDRLGDAGIIAVLLASSDEGVARCAAWVMSCRVFSRGVEWGIAEHFSNWLNTQGIVEVDVPYVATPRNALIVDVLTQLSLSPSSDRSSTDETVFCGDGLNVPKHHVKVLG